MWVMLLGRATHALETWTTSVGVQVHTLLAACFYRLPHLGQFSKDHLGVRSIMGGHSARVKTSFSGSQVLWMLVGGWVGAKTLEHVCICALKHFRDCVSDVSRNIHLYISSHSFIHSMGRKCLKVILRRYQQVGWAWQQMLYYATLQLVAFPATRIAFFIWSLPTSMKGRAQHTWYLG